MALGQKRPYCGPDLETTLALFTKIEEKYVVH